MGNHNLGEDGDFHAAEGVVPEGHGAEDMCAPPRVCGGEGREAIASNAVTTEADPGHLEGAPAEGAAVPADNSAPAGPVPQGFSEQTGYVKSKVEKKGKKKTSKKKAKKLKK